MYGVITGFVHALAVLRADGIGPEAFLPYEVSRARDVDPTFPAYVKDLMQRAIAAGHGSDDFGRLVDSFAVPSQAMSARA